MERTVLPKQYCVQHNLQDHSVLHKQYFAQRNIQEYAMLYTQIVTTIECRIIQCLTVS
jgi:hypothetical protein